MSGAETIRNDITTLFDYMDGKLSLHEAALLLEDIDLSYEEIREFLKKQPRYNVIQLNEHKV